VRVTALAALRDRAAVDALRREIARERTLFEVGRDAETADWRESDPADPFDWAVPRPLPSAKRFFFPPREAVLRWEGDALAEEPVAVIPFALFGLRACDAAALAYQDRFFARDLRYQARRGQALIVVVDCVAACDGGFCRDMDAGPFAARGFDLALTPLADGRVAAVAGTDAGRAVLAAAGVAVAADPGALAAARDAARRAAEATFPARPFIAAGIARINQRAGARPVSDAEWHALGPSCLACTGCTTLCPTCSCFAVVDEGGAERGERVRYWDSCLLEGFQREASGHHPAPHPGDRVRRFWYHKLSDDFVPEFGRYGCVGCGRCDVTCPGSIGALRVLATLGGRP
jgi:sulfhydrogenase subunit beta (sulfur reductase)